VAGPGWAENDLVALVGHVIGAGDVPPALGFASRLSGGGLDRAASIDQMGGGPPMVSD